MLAFNHEYEPFFRNGLLCLPEKTVSVMLRAGLSPQIAEVARRGLLLEDQSRIAEITDSLKSLLAEIAARDWEFQGWTGDYND